MNVIKTQRKKLVNEKEESSSGYWSVPKAPVAAARCICDSFVGPRIVTGPCLSCGKRKKARLEEREKVRG